MRKPNTLPLLLVAVVLLYGTHLRTVDLGEAHFNNDELYHLYAAQSLERGEGPLLPSGEVYDRGLDVTRLVGVTTRFVENTEVAARLPSVLIGIAGLVLFAALGWLLVGPWGALWAVLLLSISPEVIHQSRITRFYTYQVFFGVIALYTGWRALRSAGRPPEDRERLRVQWGWIALTLAAFAMALRAQETTISVIAAWGALVALAALFDIHRLGRDALRGSASLQLSILGLAGGLTVLLVAPSFPAELWARAQFVAAWAGGEPGDPRTYYWWLSREYPALIPLLVAVFLVAAHRHARLAVYLGAWFAIPFLLHSLLLAWKEPRYMILALPGLLLLSGMAAAETCRLARRGLERRLDKKLPRLRWNGFAASGVVALAALSMIVTTQAFLDARKGPAPSKDIDWTAARAILAEEVGEALVPVGSSMPVNTLFYWGRTDFGVATDLIPDGIPPGNGASRFTRDVYTGVPLITDPDDIRDIFGGEGRVAIAIDNDRWNFGNVSPELRETLEGEAEELCRNRCGDALLYLWDLGAKAGSVVAEGPGADSAVTPSSAPPASPSDRRDARPSPRLP